MKNRRTKWLLLTLQVKYKLTHHLSHWPSLAHWSLYWQEWTCGCKQCIEFGAVEVDMVYCSSYLAGAVIPLGLWVSNAWNSRIATVSSTPISGGLLLSRELIWQCRLEPLYGLPCDTHHCYAIVHWSSVDIEIRLVSQFEQLHTLGSSDRFSQ